MLAGSGGGGAAAAAADDDAPVLVCDSDDDIEIINDQSGAPAAAPLGNHSDSAGGAVTRDAVANFAKAVCPTTLNFACKAEHIRQCLKCKFNGKPQIELFRNFSLDIPPSSSGSKFEIPSVQSLLERFFDEEEVEYTCEKCGHDKSKFTHQIVELPRVMAVQLKRFDPLNGSKIRHPVRISPFLDFTALSPQDVGLPPAPAPLAPERPAKAPKARAVPTTPGSSSSSRGGGGGKANKPIRPANHVGNRGSGGGGSTPSSSNTNGSSSSSSNRPASGTQSGKGSTGQSRTANDRYEVPQCRCNKSARKYKIRKPSSKNSGKYFFGCTSDVGSFNRCKYWMLEDDWKKEQGFGGDSETKRAKTDKGGSHGSYGQGSGKRNTTGSTSPAPQRQPVKGHPGSPPWMCSRATAPAVAGANHQHISR